MGILGDPKDFIDEVALTQGIADHVVPALSTALQTVADKLVADLGKLADGLTITVTFTIKRKEPGA